MFKIGDKVFDIMRQEWGTVTEVASGGAYPVYVKFDYQEICESYMSDGRATIQFRVPSLTFKEFAFPMDLQERPRWRADNGCNYFYFLSTGHIDKDRDIRDGVHNLRFEVGNYFETVIDARKSKFYQVFHEEE